jgi:hypothetical protein
MSLLFARDKFSVWASSEDFPAVLTVRVNGICPAHILQNDIELLEGLQECSVIRGAELENLGKEVVLGPHKALKGQRAISKHFELTLSFPCLDKKSSSVIHLKKNEI